MKSVTSVSLGSSKLDCEFKTRFLGERFQVTRIGTEGDAGEAARLIKEWREKADAIGLGMAREP